MYFLSFTERMASGFTGVAERGGEDGSRALVGLARYPLMGEGLGFFSLGGEIFGGQIYYSYMAQFGVAAKILGLVHKVRQAY